MSSWPGLGAVTTLVTLPLAMLSMEPEPEEDILAAEWRGPDTWPERPVEGREGRVLVLLLLLETLSAATEFLQQHH